MAVPGQGMTLGDLIVRNARLCPNKPAVLFEGKTLTFADVLDRGCRLANALLAAGASRGARVAVLAQNGPEYLETFAAADLAGLTVVTLNWRLTVAELSPILTDCRPAFIIFEARYADKVRELLDDPAVACRALCFGGESGFAEAFAAFRDSGEAGLPAIRSRPEDTACLIYTSGTTGKPKGVMLGQEGMLRSACTIALDSGARPTDRMLIVMPLFHIGARIEYLAFAVMGATVCLHRQFEVAQVAESLERDRITVAHLAPAMIQMILDSTETRARRFDGLRLVHYASAPMTAVLLRRAISRFGNIFMQLYGMTEAVVGTILHPHQHVLDGSEEEVRRLMSAGHPLTGTQIRVLRDNGESCADGETGEIVMSTVGNMQGYWNNTLLQRDVLRDGWMHTGDMGFFDGEGFLFIVDRKKDMIVSGGENIYSREVEEALAAHPAVAEAAVIGIPDDKWGEAVKACVVLREGVQVREEDLIDHVRDLIASYKKPKSIDIMTTLPRLFNGKIDKKVLREPYWQDRERRI